MQFLLKITVKTEVPKRPYFIKHKHIMFDGIKHNELQAYPPFKMHAH